MPGDDQKDKVKATSIPAVLADQPEREDALLRAMRDLADSKPVSDALLRALREMQERWGRRKGRKK
jgi:hypothetical protein